nr:hypothetical protein [Synechococcus sp. ATX 2A4]
MLMRCGKVSHGAEHQLLTLDRQHPVVHLHIKDGVVFAAVAGLKVSTSSHHQLLQPRRHPGGIVIGVRLDGSRRKAEQFSFAVAQARMRGVVAGHEVAAAQAKHDQVGAVEVGHQAEVGDPAASLLREAIRHSTILHPK